MINGVTSALGDAAFWLGLVSLSSKPLVKLDLDFQACGRDGARQRTTRSSLDSAAIGVNNLNYIDLQVRVSRPNSDRRRALHRRDRRHAATGC
jgi:hypothetical protein